MIYKEGSPFPNCTCFDDYEPTTKCQFRGAYDPCDHETPCQNGGACSYVSHNSYKCECPPGKYVYACYQYVYAVEKGRDSVGGGALLAVDRVMHVCIVE